MQNIAGVLLTAVAVAATLIALVLDELKGKKALKVGMVGFCGVVAAFGIYFSIKGLQQPSAHTSIKPNTPIAIDAQGVWQNTGVTINRGEKISISVVYGKWTADRIALSDAEKSVLPESIKGLEIFAHRTYETNGTGTLSTCTELKISGCPLPDEKWGKLIAKIGLDTPFTIGRQSIFTAANSGILYLRMNDTDVDIQNNSGVLAILIEIESP